MSLVQYKVSDRISHITLNRPEKRNSLNPELIADLTEAFRSAIQDPGVKVIILEASGEVFSAGADLEYLQQLQRNSESENLADTELLKELFNIIYSSPKMVIACVEGHAIAGGCGLVSVCDIVFSTPEAKFGYTEVKIGFIPALVACFLIRKLSESRVNELLLTGELIDADTASRYGLINFIRPAADIEKEVNSFAAHVVRTTSANSVLQTKSLIRLAQNISLDESLDAAVRANTFVRGSDDCKRGISSFLNKEKIEW